MTRDFKYLIAYIGPLSTIIGLYLGGIWSAGVVYVAFFIIPLMEFFTPGTTENFSQAVEEEKLRSRFFDWLLYLNIPLLYGILVYYYYRIGYTPLSNFEIGLMTVNVGVITGVIGINVAHELGHRVTKSEQLMSKILLLPALYMHFFIEHNRGHHKNIATKEDPATSRYGESLYAFFVRSVCMGYLSAWKIENKRLAKAGIAAFSWQNEMLRFQIIQFTYLALITFLFGWKTMLLSLVIGFFAFLMLELVNYIEHYGLERKKLPSGRYEPVQPIHSWNSNHEIGRIFLYELTRHSDHHFKATRKYQVLRHFDESPQLPYGYPACMLASLIPPLWFKMMNERAMTYRA